MEMKKISMDIPIEDYNFLKDSNINMTELFRLSIDRIRQHKKEKVSSLMFLASVMGIVFSITLIGIGLTTTPIDYFMRGLLCILGGVLAVASMLAYNRERRK